MTGRDSRNQKFPYMGTRDRKKENARVWENASGRTKTTGCINLCTQRVACDSNTGRFFPPASSPPPPSSSSSPLSNSRERPADLQKTANAISRRRRGRYLLASRLWSRSAKARGRDELRGKKRKRDRKGRGGGGECQKTRNGEREGEGERISVQNLVLLICIIYKSVRFSALSTHVPFREEKGEERIKVMYVIIHFGAKHMHVTINCSKARNNKR